jgi:CheY-like chemotaxis protein
MMGGDLTVVSQLGQGSTFTISLPAEVREIPAEATGSAGLRPQAPGQPPPSPTAPLVLVVDDDASARDLLERSLTREGFRVQVATGGAQAVELARALRPQVITLDVMMPGIDGWAVLTTLKADPLTAPIPVVMVTIVEDKNMGIALGAADYVTKPIDWTRLAAVMKPYRRSGAPRRVLVVEDEPAAREMLRRTLEREGWQVAEAENGRVGLARLETEVPHVILLDLMMPEMDGFEFMVALRQRPEWQKLPVLVVTAKDLTEEDRRRLNGNVIQILQKGAYSKEELLREVRHLIALAARLQPDQST